MWILLLAPHNIRKLCLPSEVLHLKHKFVVFFLRKIFKALTSIFPESLPQEQDPKRTRAWSFCAHNPWFAASPKAWIFVSSGDIEKQEREDVMATVSRDGTVLWIPHRTFKYEIST